MVHTGGVIALPLSQLSFQVNELALQVGCGARVHEARGINVGDLRGGNDGCFWLEVEIVEQPSEFIPRVWFPGVDLGSRLPAGEATEVGPILGSADRVHESRPLADVHLGVVLVLHAAHANEGVVHRFVIDQARGILGGVLGGVLGGALRVGHLVGERKSEGTQEGMRVGRGDES